MFLHLGGDVEVPIHEVIGIFDILSTECAEVTKEFLLFSEEEGFIQKISEDPPKSFVITERRKQSIIYLSPISSVTLQKRSDFFRGIENVYMKRGE